MISTVLFDFGGLIIKTPFELVGADWRGPFDPAGDALWRAFQAGEMTERQYWHLRASQLHPHADDPIGQFMEDIYDVEERAIVRPQIAGVVDRLQGLGLRTAVLTNDLRAFHSDGWVQRMTILSRFDPMIDLSHVGVLKPSSEAFEHATELLAVDPCEVVFWDDQPANVTGGREHGYRSVWFDPTSVDESIRRLFEAIG